MGKGDVSLSALMKKYDVQIPQGSPRLSKEITPLLEANMYKMDELQEAANTCPVCSACVACTLCAEINAGSGILGLVGIFAIGP